MSARQARGRTAPLILKPGACRPCRARDCGSKWTALLREYLPILIFLGIADRAVGRVRDRLADRRAAEARTRRSSRPTSAASRRSTTRAAQFDVRFYLVAILFIIFDLEVAFLFPWAVTLGDIGVFGFWSMVVFLGVLTDRLHLRMEEGGAGMGVTRPVAPAVPRARSGPAPSRTPLLRAVDRGDHRTRASSSPSSTSWSPGRAPARCGR